MRYFRRNPDAEIRDLEKQIIENPGDNSLGLRLYYLKLRNGWMPKMSVYRPGSLSAAERRFASYGDEIVDLHFQIENLKKSLDYSLKHLGNLMSLETQEKVKHPEEYQRFEEAQKDSSVRFPKTPRPWDDEDEMW